MHKLIVLCFVLMSTLAQGQADNTAQMAIKAVLDQQVEAWNSYDLEAFMEGYWKSDSLAFFGKSGITYGWQQTLENYKKGYPDKQRAGTLSFKIERISEISVGSHYVMGRFFLKREIGDAEGVFMLVFKQVDGKWRIIADMSCG